MNIELIVVGKTDMKEVEALVSMYTKRLNHYVRFAITTLADVRNTKKLSEAEQKRLEGEAILMMLDMYGIAASSGSACASGDLDPSHVLLAIGLPHEIAHGSLRLSISEETTDEEIEYVIETIPPVIQRLRDMSPLYEGVE